MTRQEQEALSKRYAIRACITPLSDGSFAVFSLDLSSESLLIVENADDLVLAIVSRAAMLQRKTPSKGDESILLSNRKGSLDFDEDFFNEM